MINPIDYETAQGMLQTEAAFTNRPYFINRRLDRTAEQLAQEQQYSPINYGKIVSADGFEGNVGKFKRPEDTGVTQSDIGAATSLANIYYGFKQQKLAEKELNENLALQRANYRNQARAMNAQYRDQMSGRGTTVMSGSSKRKLGEMYANRRVSETY